MDGSDYPQSPHDWSLARTATERPVLLRLARHPDRGVRLGLLHNILVDPPWADAIARLELKSAGNELPLVRREVARSRRVSPELLCEVALCGEWEVWAIVLHNPECPHTVLEIIVSFTSADAAVVREYAYLVSRAKEIIKERAKAAPSRAP